VGKFTVLSRNSPGETRKNQEIYLPGQTARRPKFEPNKSHYVNRCYLIEPSTLDSSLWGY